MYSKRPHDLLAKEKRQENIFSIRTTNPPKKTLHARQNERVSDESERGKCLVGTPNPLFLYFNMKDKQVLWKAWVRACHLNSLHYFQFYYTISELQLKHTINSLSFKWLIKKDWTSGACRGVRAHLFHSLFAIQRHFQLHAFNNRILLRAFLLRRFIKAHLTK